MQKSSFFNSINGDRKYNASDYAAYFGSFIGNGVYPNPGNNLAVTAVGGMNISVAAGKAWINGYYYENTGTFNISIDAADGVLKRIDRIVLRLDHLNRQIVLSVLKGTPASTPTASLLTRTSDIYELGIADILINNGDTAILQGNITDQRLNNDLCGIVHGTVEQVNTSEIFNQYQAALDSFKKEKYVDFITWVENLKDILDENTAGNLLNSINDNTSNLDAHSSDYVRQPFSGKVDNNSTSTDYKVTLTPPLTAYVDGLPITIIPNVDCGVSPTLNICGLGTTPLLDADGVALTAGAMKANKPYSFVRVGNNFFIRNGSGGKPLGVNYTGSCKIVAETATKGYIECYSSGTLSFSDRLPQTVDVFLAGGGGGGSSSGNSYVGGGGGAGGYTKTFYKVKPSTPVAIYVGSGGTAGSSGGSSTYTGLTSASGGGGATSSNGANGGSAGGGGMVLSTSAWSSGGIAGSNGGNGTPPHYNTGSSGAGSNGTGQGTPTTDFFGRIHAAGGAGGAGGNTSTGVGASGDPGTSSFTAGSGSAGQTGSVGVMGCAGGNGGGGYGGGGGGGGYGSSTRGTGGTGGSGVVIVRWGY
ncbi:glycine-rich domain-containing protein [Ruminiclostridium cellulolyticum]|uniref:Glycine-rich domain-containing protein n=1 Tax=Ruminiclostridium cellulolyticum (strain ATCC 35319 / DSM 5812 / JCM 6584 / H10) TaxID=394503 RepID=B8I8H1_RUMCH|nr:hypothetical protein [Ruminiclostridium cellulolyticum]ACL75204.1 hypothetical protein Ccel_0827 [Ruminiclostridium cellulolyticum H10]